MGFNSGGSNGISGASDVALSAVADDQVLTYASSSKKWSNKTMTGGGTVSSVNAKTGAVVIAKADVGLGSVDNTSDTGKPVSIATQAALGGKVGTSSPGMRFDYGTSLPAAGTEGRFFIVVPE